MNEFSRCNKVSGVHWLQKSLKKLKIKITLKPQEGILTLPKFEEYTNRSKLNLENTEEEYTFRWQQKVFSAWEIQRYTDIHSCITDIELKYNDIIDNIEGFSKIFTYVHEDGYLPLDFKQKTPALVSFETLDSLRFSEGVARMFGGSTVSTQHLFTSHENVSNDEEEWRAMHVVFDNSDYNEDSQLVFKQEVTLLSLYHNVSHNYLIITPDVNNLELNPYTVESAAGVPWGYQYAVDIGFEETEDGDDLMVLLRKLLKNWERKHRLLMNFTLPPPGRKQLYVTLEILTASGFDMDNLYIEFDVKIPEGMQCNDILHGRTHTTEAVNAEDNKKWNYSHVVDVSLEINAGLDPPPLKLFLEAISTDWWGHHRTEGYAYHPLALDAGRYTKHLSCSRPEELDTVEAESRRFFVGGCHLIKNLDVLAQPQLQDANFNYQTTGTISLCWNIVSQTSFAGVSVPPPQPSTSSASTLLQGAETALRRYKKARARLAAATKDLGDVKYGGGEGRRSP